MAGHTGAMGITTNDLTHQASQVLDRAAVTGRGLVETGGGLLESAGGLVGTSAALVELAGSLVAEAGELAGEAGERLLRAGENMADVVATEHLPVVRSRARSAAEHKLLVALVGVTLVTIILALRRRGGASTDDRVDAGTNEREPHVATAP